MSALPLIFSGSSNLDLAVKIAKILGISLGKKELYFFPDKEISVEIQENVYERDVFIVQSLFADPNIHLVELLIMIDALKRGKAKSITAIIPYYGYARQDRMVKPGMSIVAKLIADLLTNTGVTKVIVLDLHSEQIEGFFDIPVEHLVSRSTLIRHCRKFNLENAVVVAPDKGSIKLAAAYARDLNLSMALIDKERIDPFHVEMHFFIGDVTGKTVLLPDDICSTGGTLISAAQTCTDLGAKEIIAFVGHALFVENALVNIQKSPIKKIITTDSVTVTETVRQNSKIEIVSIAPLFAQAALNMFQK